MGDPLRRDREEPNEVSATPSLCQKDRWKIQAGGPGSPVSLGRISVIFFLYGGFRFSFDCGIRAVNLNHCFISVSCVTPALESMSSIWRYLQYWK